MKKRVLAVFGILLLACNLSLSGTFAASTKQFSDVPPSKHFAEAVYDLAERNIIGGYSDGTFKPGNSITRGQAAAIIAKMIKLDTKNVKNPGFKDVSTSNGYYKAIAAMAQEGIISGYPDGRYGPNDPIKRGQMASILVKAFDLPRQYGNNPFKDIGWGSGYGYSSHYENILILYHLGITTGTTYNTFSPSPSITRGQAAKMIKAAEEAKPMNMVTLGADDFGWSRFYVMKAEVNPGLFDVIFVEGKEGYRDDKIQLIPLKEGTGTFILSEKHFFEAKNYKKYYVHVKKENDKLKLTLEETDDFLPTIAELSFWNGMLKSSDEALQSVQSVQNVSLTTMDGKKVSDDVKFEQCNNHYSICIDIDKPGQYIATVRLSNGKESRYGIEATLNKTHFYYEVKSLKEELSATYDQGATEDIGEHKIVTKGYEQIAEITRETNTNLFIAHLTGKKEGTIIIEYDKPRHSEYYLQSGLQIEVKRIGSIWNVSIKQDGYFTDAG